MYLKISLFLLCVLSSLGIYQASQGHEPVLHNTPFALTIFLFIILTTSVIGFLLAMLRKSEDQSLYETKILKRDELDLPTVDLSTVDLPSAEIKTKESKRETLISDDLLVFLRLLQEEGRLIDFLKQDITTYDDSQVASASRVVHRGCSSIINKYLSIATVIDSEENSTIDFPKDLLDGSIKVQGKNGEKIRVIHQGWKLISANIPEIVRDLDAEELLIVPAEGESL